MSTAEATFPQTDPYDVTVDEDAVAAFALATNDDNPRYLDGSAVPPLFTATMIMPALWEAQRIGIGHDNIETTGGRSVHGQQDIYFRGRLRPGMTVRCVASTHCAHATKGGALVVQRIAVTDTTGAVLVEHLWSNFFVGAGLHEEVGPPIADHSFPEEVRPRLIGTGVIAVDRDQGFRYGGVSGDRVGHSLSDAVARSEGYPGKILQGMCTFALASGALVDMVADGDPERVRRLATRFARPAFPRKPLEVHVYDVGRSENGAQVYAFEGVQDGIAVLKHGRVEVTPSR